MPALKGAEAVKVKKLLAAVKGGQLFCDPDFPTTNASLYHENGEEIVKQYQWKRPHELVPEPKMFVEGATRSDVKQGLLGDCWFLAACTAVATRPDLIQQVIPENQVLYGEGYTGLVLMRFWRMGEWVTIITDDRLPVDEDGDLLYGKCRDPNEFWLPVLEKAFAKFHGNYNGLDGGTLLEGLISLTGFIVEGGDPSSQDRNLLFAMLRQEFKNGSLVVCSRGSVERKGLVTGHAYTVTGAKSLRTETEGLVRLVRVRNPWGSFEWSGAWGDGDARWQKLDESIKKELEYTPSDDGEFWIKMSHFMQQFDEVVVAMKLPDFYDNHGNKINNLIVMHDAWKKGRNAGGPRYNIKKFATNSQYLLIVTEPDDIEECEPGEASDDEEVCKAIETCSVVVELVQEHDRKKYADFHEIAITVYPYQKPKPHKRLTANDLSEFKALEDSTEYVGESSVVARLSLKPGPYVIIPSTLEPDQSREFLLRVYCRKPVQVKELC